MAERHTYNLGFISDEDIFSHVRQTVELYRTKINLREFNKKRERYAKAKEMASQCV